jgi:hypothetical protein
MLSLVLTIPFLFLDEGSREASQRDRAPSFPQRTTREQFCVSARAVAGGWWHVIGEKRKADERRSSAISEFTSNQPPAISR